MKNLLLAAIIFLPFFSCGDSKSETSNTSTSGETVGTKNSHVLIFIDKTQSVDITKNFVYSKYQATIKELIAQNIKTKGDILEIYYIHENTSKAKCLSVNTRTEKENIEGLNATDLEAAGTNYEMGIQKERNQFFELAMQKMMEKNTGSSNKETNVSGSIPIIANAVTTNKEVKVFYFSDMVESLKSGRDFHKLAPISHDQAEEWAKSDVLSYKNYTLGGAQINIILPFEPTSSTKENNPNISDYWKTYFDTLGATSINEI